MRNMAKKLVSKMRRAVSSLSGRKKTSRLCNAGVVDHQRHIRRQRCGGRHVFRLGDVESQGLNTGLGDGRGVTCAGVDLAGAAGEQLAREGQADAAIGTGDEGNSVFNLHENPQRRGTKETKLT